MATNVPPITFGPNGAIIPEASAVLAGVIADFQAAFGGNLNLSISNPSSLSTPQGQLATSMAAAINKANEDFLLQSTQTDPAYAFGRWQDAIARIYFIFRIGSQPTVLQVVCNGLAGVVINDSNTGLQAATVQDEDGNVYSCTEGGVIGAGGTVTLPFANQVPGPIAVPDAVTIYQAVPGWDSAAVASGLLGIPAESRQSFETRRAATVAGNSFGAIGSIIGAVSQVDGVIDFFGYDNATSAPATVAGVSVAANSIFVCVAGGDPDAVAAAIFSKKAPGCAYTGNTTVTVHDDNPLYSAPIPYNVTFETPDALQILFAVAIADNPGVPANAAALIQAAIIAAFAGNFPGTPRARIGSTLFASRFYGAVAALGSWAEITEILIGSTNAPSATFTASIAGATMTVSAVASGTIAIGQTVVGVGVAVGTKITAGAGSSWTVTPAQTVGSSVKKSAVAGLNTVSVNGDQVPEVVAANIAVTVS